MECIFCKLVKGEIPSAKLYEDDHYLAFLDAFPNKEAQTLVIPKKHVTQVFSEVPDKELKECVLLAKQIAKKIDAKLGTRSCLVIEGLDVPHFHVKIYPLTLKKGEYFGTESGDKADLKELEKLAKKIRGE